MAYKPSERRHVAQDDTNMNMTPIMNLMVVLIPLLLSSAQLIKISVIELNLPPAASLQNEQTQKKKPKLDLAVTITDKGFYLSSSQAVLKTQSGPSIPKKDGKYDYTMLSDKLLEIKNRAGGRFEDIDSIVIQAESKIKYQILVSTMDAARSIRKKKEVIALFPDVSVSAQIL